MDQAIYRNAFFVKLFYLSLFNFFFIIRIKKYNAKENQDHFFLDRYTSIFNNDHSNEKKDDLDFLNYSTSKEFVFNSDVFRNRLIYLNTSDNFSLKIAKFMISSSGLTRRNKPVLSVIMNNSECYLLSFHDENSIKEYKIVNTYKISL